MLAKQMPSTMLARSSHQNTFSTVLSITVLSITLLSIMVRSICLPLSNSTHAPVGNAPDLAAWAVSFASANSDIVSIASADAEL